MSQPLTFSIPVQFEPSGDKHSMITTGFTVTSADTMAYFNICKLYFCTFLHVFC